MDIALIPENQKWSSKSQREFILHSSIPDIVARYNTSYRSHKKNPSMHYCISYTKSLLLHLQSLGLLVSTIDSSGWLLFKLSNNYDVLIAEGFKSYTTEVSNQQTIDIVQPLSIKEIRNNSYTPELDKILAFKLRCISKMKEIIKRCISIKLEFNLDLSDVEELLSATHCYYTHQKFDEFNQMTIDRIDSKKGYIKGNVVPCSSKVNSVKSSILECDAPTFKDIYELKSFVDKIYAHLDDDPLKDLLIK